MPTTGLTINHSIPIPEAERQATYIYPALWEKLHGQYFIEVYFDPDKSKWLHTVLSKPDPKSLWMFSCFENIDDVVNDQILLKIRNNQKRLEDMCVAHGIGSLRSLRLIFQFKVIPPQLSSAFLNFFTAKIDEEYISYSFRNALGTVLPGSDTYSFDELYNCWLNGLCNDNTFYAITPNGIYHYKSGDEIFTLNDYKEHG